MIRAGVVVRTLNSADTLEACLTSLRDQDVPLQVVVVDSGSTDGTLALAERWADTVLTMTQEEFTYGGALNLGAEAVEGDAVLNLSSHCVLPRSDWARLAMEHLEAGAGAVIGLQYDAFRRPLSGPLTVPGALLSEQPHWGLSNHASAISRALWAADPFDTQRTAGEDKEWSWRALQNSTLVADPRLVVPGTHRRAHGVRAYYRRRVKEMAALTDLRPLSRLSLPAAAREWTRSVPLDPYTSRSRAFGRTRAVEVLARWHVGRRG